MSSFTLIFPDEAEPLEYSEIDFCFKFKLDFLKLKCGKFDPPIRFKNELVEIIHFTNFSFKDNLFIFNPNFIQLTLTKKIKIRFSVLNHPSKVLNVLDIFYFIFLFILFFSTETIAFDIELQP